MRLGFGLGPSKTGPSQYLTINSVKYVLLTSSDGQALQGADGQYLYGVA